MVTDDDDDIVVDMIMLLTGIESFRNGALHLSDSVGVLQTVPRRCPRLPLLVLDVRR